MKSAAPLIPQGALGVQSYICDRKTKLHREDGAKMTRWEYFFFNAAVLLYFY